MLANNSTSFGQSDIDVKSKKEKEILIVNDVGFFQHETGDTYDGSFEAKKKDRSVRMHGAGVYKTAEGDVYNGMWDNDKLVSNLEDVEITYASGSKYKGRVREWCYQGRGEYTYPDNCVLTCEFQENAPTGRLQLIDPNGHTWLGKAGTGNGWFNPVNHYYEMLEATREIVKTKKHLSTKVKESTLAKESSL